MEEEVKLLVSKQIKKKNDPRDFDFVNVYDRQLFSKGDESGGTAEIYQLISVVTGMYAFMMRTKWACWLAAFYFYTSVINSKSEHRWNSVITGMSIIMISFVNCYFAPATPSLPEKLAETISNLSNQ